MKQVLKFCFFFYAGCLMYNENVLNPTKKKGKCNLSLLENTMQKSKVILNCMDLSMLEMTTIRFCSCEFC